jgi:hypothetical protein
VSNFQILVIDAPSSGLFAPDSGSRMMFYV